MEWQLKRPGMRPEALGFIPTFLQDDDPRPAKDQFHERYAHGGGWDSFVGFKMLPDGSLQYPGDPPYPVIAETRLRDEIVRVYPSAWVSITQADGSYEVCRID